MIWHNKLSLVFVFGFLLAIFGCNQEDFDDEVALLKTQDLPVSSTILPTTANLVLEDSVIASITSIGFFNIGQTNDSFWGKTTYSSYLQIRPQSFVGVIPKDAVFEKAEIKLIGSTHIGADIKREQKISIHEISTELPNSQIIYSEDLPSIVPGAYYKAEAIASISYNFDQDREEVTSSAGDTSETNNLTITQTLDSDFSQRLFNSLQLDNTDRISSLEEAKNQFKGLAFISGDDNSLISAFNVATSTIDITFTKADGTSGVAKYIFTDISTNIFVSRFQSIQFENSKIEEVTIPDKNVMINSDTLGVNGSTGTQLRISLQPLRDFFTKIEQEDKAVKFNNVSVILDNVVLDPFYTDSLNFFAKIVKEDNIDLKARGVLRTIKQNNFSSTISKIEDIVELGSTLSYSKNSENKYQINFTFLAEAMMLDKVSSEEDLLLLATGFKSIERFKVHKDDIKIRIIYSSF